MKYLLLGAALAAIVYGIAWLVNRLARSSSNGIPEEIDAANAWEDGYAAAFDGMSGNPHKEGSRSWAAWNEGAEMGAAQAHSEGAPSE